MLPATSHQNAIQLYPVESYELLHFSYENATGYFTYLLVMQRNRKKKETEIHITSKLFDASM